MAVIETFDNLQECIEAHVHLDDVDQDGDCIRCQYSDRYVFGSRSECFEDGNHLSHTDEDGECLLCGSSQEGKHDDIRECLLAREHHDDDEDGVCIRCGCSDDYLFDDIVSCGDDGHHLEEVDAISRCLLCGNKEKPSEEEEEEEEEGEVRAALQIAVYASLDVDRSLREDCGLGTEELSNLISAQTKAWSVLTPEEKSMAEYLLAGDEDGTLPHPPTTDVMARIYRRVFDNKYSTTSLVLGRTVRMLDRRLGESPIEDTLRYEEGIWYVHNDQKHFYACRPPQEFIGCKVRISFKGDNVNGPIQRYNFEHIWVEVKGLWEDKTNPDDADELAGFICYEPWADEITTGDLITFKVSEITDIYCESANTVYRSKPDGAEDLMTVWSYSNRPYDRERAKTVWPLLSDKERIHVSRSAARINIRRKY